jgi:hypothetical protein
MVDWKMMTQAAEPTGRKHILWRVCGMVFVGHVALKEGCRPPAK